MLRLIDHIVRTSAQRDRTDINEALVFAMADLFHPKALTIYRAFRRARQTIVFACAGIGQEGSFLRNAYLPDARYCQPIDADPLLERGERELAAVFDFLPDGGSRLVFPIVLMDRLLYLIDITVPEDLSPKQRTVLMGLVEYFGNHIALLDHGESDTLTGLPNRKTFDKHLFEVLGQAAVDEHQKTLEASAQKRRKGSNDGRHWLAVCDIDHFKSVNDIHGHLIGDEVLVMFAHLMRDTFRYQDQVYRFGGEEFVAVLQPTSRDNVRRVFERFRQAVEKHVFSRVGSITISIGYSQVLANDTPPDIIERADEALYYVKQHGRNDVACYEELVKAGKLASKSSRAGEMELF